MLIYNIGVVLFFSCLALFLFARCYYFLGTIPLMGTIYPWGRDICWLLFASPENKKDYEETLRKDDT
jgi:hypothetical protein